MTFCESVISEKYLWNKLEEIVYYGHRLHQGLEREARRAGIIIAFYTQWIESRV